MEMHETPTRHPDLRRAGRWLVVVLLAGAAAGLAVELVRGTQPATGQVVTAGEAGRFVAVAGQISKDTYGLYLIDRQSGIITVYQWLAGTKKLRLLAARNTTYDLQLDEYNTEPSPSEIQRLVQQSRRLSSPGSP